ncbi:MAG: hypothetical protein FJ388_08235 [Verrucomicrobia bacterium]|nr:hypothetical protein [Verrucomicrobiota bacterium]
MIISFRCPQCRTELSFDNFSRDNAPCPNCRHRIELRITDAMRQRNVVDRCVICESPDVRIKRYFNLWFGVILFVLAAAFAWWLIADQERPWQAVVVLVVAGLVDFVLYRFLPAIMVCVRCHAQYRRFTKA